MQILRFLHPGGGTAQQNEVFVVLQAGCGLNPFARRYPIGLIATSLAGMDKSTSPAPSPGLSPIGMGQRGLMH